MWSLIAPSKACVIKTCYILYIIIIYTCTSIPLSNQAMYSSVFGLLVHLSIHSSIYLSVHPLIHPSIHPLIYPPLHFVKVTPAIHTWNHWVLSSALVQSSLNDYKLILFEIRTFISGSSNNWTYMTSHIYVLL